MSFFNSVTSIPFRCTHVSGEPVSDYVQFLNKRQEVPMYVGRLIERPSSVCRFLKTIVV